MTHEASCSWNKAALLAGCPRRKTQLRHTQNTQQRSKTRCGRNLARRFLGLGLGIGSSGLLPFDPLHLTAHAGWPCSMFTFGGNQSPPRPRKRILILCSTTGEGYKSSAEAIKSGFESIYRDKYDVQIIDIWTDHSPYILSKMPELYKFLVRNPFIYRILYLLLNPRWIQVPYFKMLVFVCFNHCNDAFEMYKPDLVISVHPLLQHIPIKILHDRIRAGVQKPISFATVVTDYTTCQNSWFHKQVTQCFVPTEYCYNIGINQGLKPSQLTLHGLPIRPEFAKNLPSKHCLRRKLKMLRDVPAALLVGGGEGMGNIEQIVHAIETSVGADAQLVVICGHNEELRQNLSERKYSDGMKVKVHGFVNNMNEWMCACDVVVTKAGSTTMAEALICGTPVLHNGFIPGQEAGNIPYVIGNGVGKFEMNPDRIAETFKEWFVSRKHELKERSIEAKSLGRADALDLIVRDLAALCDHPILDPCLDFYPQELPSRTMALQGENL